MGPMLADPPVVASPGTSSAETRLAWQFNGRVPPLPRILLVNPFLLIDTTDGACVSQRSLAQD